MHNQQGLFKVPCYRLTDLETYGCWGEGIVRDFGKVMYTLLYLKWITNKNLPYIACGTLLNVMCHLDGRGFGGE